MLELDLQSEEKLRKIWSENNFSLDIPIIDLQHIWLIWLLLQMEEEVLQPDSPESDARTDYIISELVSFTTEHLWLEECLMEHTKFSENKEHTSQHNRFIEEVSRQIHGRMENRKEQISQLIGFLKNWLFGHILIEDSKYKKFFLRDNIDIRPFFEDLIKNQRSVVISKIQAELYNRICRSNMSEVSSKDVAVDVYKIWKAYSLNLGIPIMDIQHLWLVKMIVELEQANKSTSSKERDEMFQKTILEAVQYAKNHFQVEENLMKEFQYPELGIHFKTHRNFMEFISARNVQKKDKLFPASIGLVNDLKEWLISHIAIEDKQLSLFLKTRSNEVESYINMKKDEGVFRLPQSQMKFYLQIKNM